MTVPIARVIGEYAMSYIPDMEKRDSGYYALGWLHPDHSFPRADAAPEFLERLKEFARRYGESAEALGWGAIGGCHVCEFCGKALGFGSFGVAAGDKLFHAPEMIAHYVEAHRYAPPAEFVAAVLACPLPGTPEYFNVVAPFAWRLA